MADLGALPTPIGIICSHDIEKGPPTPGTWRAILAAQRPQEADRSLAARTRGIPPAATGCRSRRVDDAGTEYYPGYQWRRNSCVACAVSARLIFKRDAAARLPGNTRTDNILETV